VTTAAINPRGFRASPVAQLHEENELIWNDGVAPEACLDFDAPHYTSAGGLFMWAGAFFSLYLVYKLYGTVDWNTKRKAVRRLACRLRTQTTASCGLALSSAASVFSVCCVASSCRPPVNFQSPPALHSETVSWL
jgi:hypothetical protein